MSDRQAIDPLLEQLASAVDSLEGLSRISPESLMYRPEASARARDQFVVALETCVDLAHHIMASEHGQAPHEDTTAFAALAAEGWVDDATAEQLAGACRFRDRLVTEFWETNDELVISYLIGERLLFDRFRAAVIARLAAA